MDLPSERLPTHFQSLCVSVPRPESWTDLDC